MEYAINMEYRYPGETKCDSTVMKHQERLLS
jgi:hypothetical protein